MVVQQFVCKCGLDQRFLPRRGGSRELALELKVSSQCWKLRVQNKKQHQQ